MKLTQLALTALGLGMAFSATAASENAPRFVDPNPGQGCVINGLSNNGRWAVESILPSEDGSIITIAGRLFDLDANPVKVTEIKHKSGLVTVNDVTDDGKIVAGSANGLPAYWLADSNTWVMLPMPVGAKGGCLNAITPDGKYAAGVNYTEGSQFDGESPCFWDLTTGKLVDLPDFPWLDRQNNDEGQNRILNITPDGRYIYGSISFSYVMPTAVTPYVYDRETKTTRYIGLTKTGGVNDQWGRNPENPSYLNMIENGDMSPNGKYITSQAYLVKDATELSATEYYVSCRYDLDSSELHLIDGEGEADYASFAVGDSGTLYCANPAMSPYRNACVRYGDYYYGLDQILRQVYGVNYEDYGISVTGTPAYVSGDEKTIVFITSQKSCYVLKLQEPLSEACSKVDLLGDWTPSIASGTAMTEFSGVQLTFTKKLSTNANNYRNVKLLNSAGNTVTTALSQGGVQVDGQKLNIQFRTVTLDKDEEYTLVIPAGTVWLGDDKSMANKEIRLTYIGRGDAPVAMVSSNPADHSNVAKLSMTIDPIILTFDSQVKVNPNAAELGIPTYASLYREDDEIAIGMLSVLDAKTTDKHNVLVAPVNQIELYKGTDYRIVIPAGLLVDLSGAGANEKIEITFHGSFTIPPPINPGHLWSTDCSNYNDALFYEGDHRVPTAAVSAMGFTQDTTPWSVVRESEQSSDMAWASHSMYIDGGQANDWFTTTKIFITDDSAYMTFDSQSWKMDKEDRLKVYVWEENSNLNALTETHINRILAEGTLIYDEIQSPGKNEETFTGDWRHNELSLAQFAGKNVYICFLNDNTNQSMVIVDNIYVGSEASAGVVLTTPTSVVDQTSVPVGGFVTLGDNTKTYTGVKVELINAEGDAISTVEDETFVLNNEEMFAFTFPEKLPVTVGEVNNFTINMTLGKNVEGENFLSSSSGHEIYDLAFRPDRKVVIEEFTGRACPNCPRGIQAFTLLEQEFPDQIIPIALYCYQSDPKGMSVQDYNSFLGLKAAPTGRVNRGPISDPMPADAANNCFRLSGRDYGLGDSWYDYVRDAVAEPSYLDVKLVNNTETRMKLKYTATVTSAINMDNANIRVFGVLLENGLVDWQQNGLASYNDPLLGEWANNGIYATPRVQNYTFDHAAKAVWGDSYVGTRGLIPNELVANDPVDVEIEMALPAAVEDINNCDFVVMLIDDMTGEVLNAAKILAYNSVMTVGSDEASITIGNVGGAVTINSAIDTEAVVYSIDGRAIASGRGNGEFSIDLRGYNGVAIVKAVNAETSASVKIFAK